MGDLNLVLGLATSIYLTSFFRSKFLCPLPTPLSFLFAMITWAAVLCGQFTLWWALFQAHFLCPFENTFLPLPLAVAPTTLLGSMLPPPRLSPSLTCHNELHWVTRLRPDGKVIITAAIVSSVTNAHWNDQKVSCTRPWLSPGWVAGCNFSIILVKMKAHVLMRGGTIESHSGTRSDDRAGPCLEERLGVRF